jgi:hypothetical protein
MLLNISCFLAVCQPNDILLSSFGAAVGDRISAFLFPAPSSDTKRISVVGERFSLIKSKSAEGAPLQHCTVANR